MTETTLVTGGSLEYREAALANLLGNHRSFAVILEGISESATDPLSGYHKKITRIAPGCPCCSGNLTMRVILNRILRSAPEHLFIGLASDAHLHSIRDFLSQPPYDTLLKLKPDIRI